VMGIALLIIVDEAVMMGPGGPVYGGIYRGCSRLGINLSWRAVVMLYGGSFGVSSSVRLPVASVVLVVAEGARTDSIKPEDFFTVGRSVSRLSDI
jgi:hypothetical protein